MTQQAANEGTANSFKIETPEEARAFIAAATVTIEDLRDILRRETDLIGQARFREAAELSDAKSGLVSSYTRYMITINTSGGRLKALVPREVSLLIATHDTLSDAARDNLPTVERARDTTFRIIKGLNGVVEKRQAGPSTYGPGAMANAPKPTRSSPLSLDTAI